MVFIMNERAPYSVLLDWTGLTQSGWYLVCLLSVRPDGTQDKS
jgi:hypothetical protein